MGPKAKAVAAPLAAAEGATSDEPASMEVEVQGEAPACAPVAPKAVSSKLQKRRRRCDCGTAEACFACRRCLEQHCVCGAAERAAVTTLCPESRACNCRVPVDGASRCVLCQGCRQPHSNRSHCRCVQHQEVMQRVANGEKKQTEVSKSACRCFDRMAVDPEQQKRRRKRLALAGRRAGIPSSHGLYSKKVAGALGDFDESDIESDAVNLPADAFPVARTDAEELEDMMSVAGVLNSKLSKERPAPQHALEWSTTKPFQASIAHTSQTIAAYQRQLPRDERDVIFERIMQMEMERAFENALRTKDREGAMPSEEIVDYLLLAASIKASRMPELIGSLDNTAATAVGVVVEEYVRQLVVRADRQSLCQTTKATVQDFASMVLRDFNFELFLHKLHLPTLMQLSEEQSDHVTEELVELIFTEFLATQRAVDRGGLMASAKKTPLCGQIQEIVAAEMAAARAHGTADDEPSPLIATATLGDDSSVKAVKITQRTSKLTGQLIYKYDVAATIGDKHIAKVALDGFESRQGAERSIAGMRKALGKEDTRVNKIEHPSPPRPVEDPIVSELYKQLLQQVKQSRSSLGKETAPKSSGKQKAKLVSTTDVSGDDSDISPRPRSRRRIRQPASPSSSSVSSASDST